MDPITLSGLFAIGGKLIDKLFPDPRSASRPRPSWCAWSRPANSTP